MSGSGTDRRTDTDTALRRTPTQQRAKDRVERILDCAAALIAGHGSDALRMNELAKAAGIAIGSLYQYFPDKSAILRTLAERYNAMGRACISEELAGVRTTEELCEAFERLVGIYYAQFLAEPVMRDIWSGTQTDRELRELDLADSRANAAELARALARIHPDAGSAAFDAPAFLIFHLGEATMRLAVSVDRAEGDVLVETYKRMVRTELARLGGSGALAVDGSPE